MQLNLSDPDSIVQWWRVLPERHWGYLEMFESRSPQFRHEIRAARRRIQADPLYSRSRIEEFDAALEAAWAQMAPDEVEQPAEEEAFA